MDYQSRPTVVDMEREDYNAPFHKLMRMFTISILISFIGTAIGTIVPPALFLPLVVVELVMVISAFMIRRGKKAIGYPFVFAFTFISGVTLYPTIAHYANIGGNSLILTAFTVTTAGFAALSFYAYFSKRDFSFLGGMLTIGLITLIGFGIISLFTGGLGGGLGLGIAVLGVLVFSGYILYDISNYKQGLSEELIPLAVMSLYLDFINLFLFVLRLLGILSSDD
jgi:uncharacterized protein